MAAVPLTYSQRVIYRAAQHLQLPLIPRCVRIKGPIETGDFERAAAQLMTLHPILGSRLELSDGELMQRQGNATASFELLDIEGSTDQHADHMLSALADSPLDLFSENPFRAVLARNGTDTAFLLLTGHHAFLDGRALHALLIEYLSLALNKSQHQTDASWDSGDRSFLSYALAEQKMVANGDLSRMGEYWVGRHRECDPVLHFPVRNAEPATQSMKSVPFRLDQDSFRAFSGRARRLQVSNFALATTAIFHAFQQVTGQDSILLSAVADARRPPFDRTIGNFAGMYLVNQEPGNKGMGDNAVRMVFEELIQAMAYYVPQFAYGEQVGWLHERLEKGFAMTDAVIQYLPPARATLGSASAWPGYEISNFPLTAWTQRTNIPYHGVVMRITVLPQPDSLSASVDYESSIINSDAAGAIADLIRGALTLED